MEQHGAKPFVIIDSTKVLPLHYCPNCHTPTRPLLLTTRQLEIIKLLTKGFTLTEIGRRLYISKGTVDTHITNICQIADIERGKHGMDTNIQLVRWAINEGLVE